MCFFAPLLAAAAGAGGLSAGLGLASAGLSAIGSIQSGNAAAAAANSDAKVARMNAELINDQIADQRLIAGDNNRRQGEEAAAHIGQQKVGIAAGNLDMTMGSPLQALIASADASARDAAHIMDNNMRQVRDLRQEQANYRTSARSSKAQAKGLRRAGYMQAAGSLLSGGAGYYKARAELE